MIKLSTIIKRDKTVIRVKDEKEELALRMALHARGLKWSVGESFATHAMKDDVWYYSGYNCINPKRGMYDAYIWYTRNGYKVYQFSQVILDK